LLGACSFVLENIKGRDKMISEAFEILEKVDKIGIGIYSFKESLASDINSDEELYVGVLFHLCGQSHVIDQ
jgi:hypothetical protein